jgi:hypothetical protein
MVLNQYYIMRIRKPKQPKTLKQPKTPRKPTRVGKYFLSAKQALVNKLKRKTPGEKLRKKIAGENGQYFIDKFGTVHQVGPAYLKTAQKRGWRPLSQGEIYGEKVIGRARKIGFKQVSEKAKK